MELKKTGVVRRIDDLGRIVIPKEFRRQMRIQENDPLELCVCDCEGQFGVLFVPYHALECNFPKRRVLDALYAGIPNKDVVVALVDSGKEYLGPRAGHEDQAELVRKEGYSMFRKIQVTGKPSSLELECGNAIYAAPLTNEQQDEVIAVLLVCGAAASVRDNKAYISAQAEIINALLYG